MKTRKKRQSIIDRLNYGVWLRTSIRNQYAELDRRQFAEFCANKSPREIAQTVGFV